MTMLETLHERFQVSRRVRRLADLIAEQIPEGSSCLDVGAGAGHVARAIMHVRPDVRIVGIDVLDRPDTVIQVDRFDGRTLPYAESAFDLVLFVDVLHHTDDPAGLIREAKRVSSGSIVIKDHLCEGFLAAPTLRLMDRVGNARFGVSLPYVFWTQQHWIDTWDRLGLTREYYCTALSLYPWPLSMVFDRGLHFLARLRG